MNRWFRVIGYVLQFLVVGAYVGMIFANPDMTQTRLFLTFWGLYVVGVVLFLIGNLMVKTHEGK